MGFAESLRYELAPLKMPLTVVFPPEVDTPMNETEAKTLPPQARAVKNMGGLLTPEFTAKEIARAIQKRSYWCVPGRRTRFLHLIHRLSNGFLSRLVGDLVIRRTVGNETRNR
jgi:short-subunit dehydrogenase